MKTSLLRVLMALFVALSLSVPALAASDFPNRTVRILVGFAPGWHHRHSRRVLSRTSCDQSGTRRW